MKRLKLAVIALFAFVTVSSVHAQDENNPWAVGFGVNAVDIFTTSSDFMDRATDYVGTSDWNILPSISRISGEKYLDKGFSLQLAGALNQIETVNTKNDSDLLYWSVDAIVKYDLNHLVGETGWFDPYVFLGGGYTALGELGEGMLNAGAGYNIWLNDNIGVNLQSGFRLGFADEVRTHWQHSLGLVIQFGGKDSDGDGVYDKNDACPEVAGLKEFNGCPDADGDGIKDSDDACPNEPGLAAMNGCPDADGDGVSDKEDMCPNEKGTKANKGCPDTDGDGVVNKDDKCPTEAGPADNNGCPWPDTDGDGVLDKDDKCPNEVGPASNNGCAENVLTESQLAMLAEHSKGVLFDFDRANVKKATGEKLDMIYDIINPIDEDVVFVVEGYTDSIGNKEYNKYLSERRAESVKAYLVKKGMNENRLEAVGHGEDNPLANNNTADGRRQNRRVIIKLTE